MLMLDLETLGTKPGCVILQLAAVEFEGEAILDHFDVKIDIKSCLEAGLYIDTETLRWWGQQENIGSVMTGTASLKETLEAFSRWVARCEPGEIWANGASFDFPILAAAYEKVGLEQPWSFQDERCLRTVRALSGVEDLTERVGRVHDAMSDCKYQVANLEHHLSHLIHTGRHL